ncbi:hypothetical protein Tco_0715467 [Tanacetum coccineum]
MFGTITSEIPVETLVIPPVSPEVEAARVASPVGVLDLITYSSSDSDPSTDLLPSPEHVSTLPATLPFLCTDSFEASSDSSDRPFSPDSHETVVARWRSKVALRSSSSKTSSPTHELPPTVFHIVPAPPGISLRHGILVLIGQVIPYGRPYRTQRDGVLKMLTARKRVHPVPTRVPANHRRFCSTPSSSPRKRRRSSCSSSLSDSPPATTTIDNSPARPSRKRCRSPTTSVPSAIPASVALSPTRADILPPRKRFRSSSTTLSPKASIEGSIGIGSEEEDIDSDIMVDIEADIAEEAAAAEEVRAETDVGFEGDDVAEEEAESSARDTIEIGIDRATELEITEDIPAPRIADVEEEQRSQEVRALSDEREMTRLRKRVSMLDGSNMRLRGSLAEERKRVSSFGRRLSYAQDELRQICLFRYHDRMDFRRLKAFNMGPISRVEAYHVFCLVYRTMTITCSGMTPEGIEELISRRMAEALKAYEGNRGGNGNGNGVGGGNEDGDPNMYAGGFVPIARDALTWWNSHKRTIGTNAAYAMTWKELMKLMTEVYCPRNEILKMETGLWNLAVKGNNLAAYT